MARSNRTHVGPDSMPTNLAPKHLTGLRDEDQPERAADGRAVPTPIALKIAGLIGEADNDDPAH